MIRVQLWPCYYWRGHSFGTGQTWYVLPLPCYVHIDKLLKILSLNSLVYNIKIISVVNEVIMLMRAKYTMSLIG